MKMDFSCEQVSIFKAECGCLLLRQIKAIRSAWL
jgi:hypothetical protein